MAHIATAGNTGLPCLQALRAKGFALRLEYHRMHHYDATGEYQVWYFADRDGSSFIGHSPEEVLGLVAMWEVRGDDWRLKPGEGAIDDDLHAASRTFDRDGNEVLEG